MSTNEGYSAAELFALDVKADDYVVAVKHAMISAASSIDPNGVHPSIVAACCDLIVSMAVHQIDVRNPRRRREVAEACRTRILDGLKGFERALDDHGADQADDLIEGLTTTRQ